MSCWHVYALEQLDNHYAFGGVGATSDDACAMLLMCGTDFSGGTELMTKPRRAERMTRAIYRKVKHIPFVELHTACLDYSTTCRDMPEVWRREGGSGKSMGGNHTWHVVVSLMSMGFSEDDAWNMTYTKARCYFDISREASGGCEIMSDRTRALIERAHQTMNKGRS